jgi:hypothetical protein
MFVQFGDTACSDTLDRSGLTAGTFARSGPLDALAAFEQIGSRRSFARNDEILPRAIRRIAGSR